MSRYTVVWLPEADDRLLEFWLKSHDRAAITDAAANVDRLLANDPDTQGVLLPDGYRTIWLNPLALVFIVHEEDRLVRIVDVTLANTN